MPQEDGRVFVCYARADQEFVLALASALKARGADLWVDQQDIQAGANWDQAIDDALNRCSCVLVVLSPLAVESREVQGELRTALDEGKTILPVVYKECRLPRVLRSIQHVDVTSGDPTDQTALDRITQALPTAVAPPGGQTTAPAATANAKPHGVERPVSPDAQIAADTAPAGGASIWSSIRGNLRVAGPLAVVVVALVVWALSQMNQTQPPADPSPLATSAPPSDDGPDPAVEPTVFPAEFVRTDDAVDRISMESTYDEARAADLGGSVQVCLHIAESSSGWWKRLDLGSPGPTIEGEGRDYTTCAEIPSGSKQITFWKAKVLGAETPVGVRTIDLSDRGGYQVVFSWIQDE